MNRSFTAKFSPVDPDDRVVRREFRFSDGAGTELVALLDPEDNQTTEAIDVDLGPGSCYLIDIGDEPSDPSPSVALVPPGPGPAPRKPKTPTILSVEWEPVPEASSAEVIDRRTR